MPEKEGYAYMVRKDFGVPVLIRFRYAAAETFDPDVPGEWRRSPGKDSIIEGSGDWVWYDDISAEEAEIYADRIRKEYAKGE